jgi:xanthine dehydrogenase iron-sulfur cluster and FAD-binding subunit A
VCETAGRTSLADLLRGGLHLTGTHLGCEHGVCGCCTVLFDGEPVRSCSILAVQADGHSVTTIEGWVTLSDGVITDCRICLTGVADVPLRCHGPERVLVGTRADPATLVRAAQAALDILDPPGDLHAPAGYRKHVAGVLLRRAVGEAFGRAAAAGEG